MKGITFVIIYSIFMLALFGVMCYLMTIVNPVVVEQAKKEKTPPELPGNETHVFYTRDDDKDLSEIHSSNSTTNLELKSKRINDSEFNFSKTNHVDKATNLEVKSGDLKIHKVAKGRRSVNSLKRNCKQNEKYVILNILDENNEPKIEIKLNVIPNERKRDKIYQNIHKSIVNKTTNEIFEGILLKDFVVKILSNNTVVIDAIEKLETRKNMLTATLNTTNLSINEGINNMTKVRQDNVINLFENKNRFHDIELHVLTYLKVDKTNISNETKLNIKKFQNDYATKTKDSKAPIGKNMYENIERFNLFNLTKEDEDLKGMNSHTGGLFDENNLNEFEPFNVKLSTNNVTVQLSNEIERFKSDNADNFQVKENLQLVKNINTPFNDNQKIGVRNYTTSNNFNIEAKQPNVLKEIKLIGEKSDEIEKNHTIQTRKKVSSEIIIKDSKKINSTIEKLNINKMPLYLHEKFNVTVFNHDLLKLNFGLVNTTNKNYNISYSKELF